MALLLFSLGIYAPKGVLRALGLIPMLYIATKQDKLEQGVSQPQVIKIWPVPFLLLLVVVTVVVLIQLENFFAYLLTVLICLC